MSPAMNVRSSDYPHWTWQVLGTPLVLVFGLFIFHELFIQLNAIRKLSATLAQVWDRELEQDLEEELEQELEQELEWSLYRELERSWFLGWFWKRSWKNGSWNSGT